MRRDGDALAGGQIEPYESGVLRLGVHDVGIGGIDPRVEPVAAPREEPVAVVGAAGGARARGSAHGAIVLRTAEHPVERLNAVDLQPVELGQWQVLEPVVGLAAVERLVEPPVAADEQVVGVVRIDPEGVVVYVLVTPAQPAPVPPPVVAHRDADVHHVDAVDVHGVGEDLLVVVAAGPAVAHALPADAVVLGAVEAGAFPCLDDGVHHVGVDRRHRQTDAAQLGARQAALGTGPRRATVGGAMHPRSGTAEDEAPLAPGALPRGGDQHVGVARVHDHIGDAGPLVGLQDAGPGLPAVGGLVEPAVAAAVEHRPLGGHVHDVGVARVDQDLGDVLGIGEPHVAPGAAGVHGLVDAVAVGDRALRVVLARAHPDHVGVVRVDDHHAKGIRALAVHDGREAGAGVGGLPHAARRRCDVPGLLVLVNGEVRDAARDHRRSDGAEPQTAYRGGQRVALVARVGLGRSSAATLGLGDVRVD